MTLSDSFWFLALHFGKYILIICYHSHSICVVIWVYAPTLCIQACQTREPFISWQIWNHCQRFILIMPMETESVIYIFFLLFPLHQVLFPSSLKHSWLFVLWQGLLNALYCSGKYQPMEESGQNKWETKHILSKPTMVESSPRIPQYN